MKNQNETMLWKIHLQSFLEELIAGTAARSPEVIRPLNLLYRIIQNVAVRASQLDDPILNGLMCQLTMYQISDPKVKDKYDPEAVDKIMEKYHSALEDMKKGGNYEA